MQSRSQYLIMMSSVCVLYIIACTSATSSSGCLSGCLRDVIRCHREKDVGLIPAEVACCEKYTQCYYECYPSARSDPPCKERSKRGSWNKRMAFAFPGSWNKRMAFPGSWNKRAPGSWNKRGSWNK